MPPLRIRPLLLLPLAAFALACDDGGGGGETVVEPPPVAEDTLEKLWSDAELATAPDPTAPAENPAWAGWVAANHWPVRSLTSRNFQDLQFLKPLLAGRRVVQLGESGHAVREYNLAKLRLIRFLHEEMGYDVVAFESNLHDCWQTGRRLGSLPAEAAVRECLFPVWHTEEVRGLMEYVKQRAGAERPLVLAGFDTQPTGTGAMAGRRPGLLGEVLAVVDPAYAERVRAMDADLSARYEAGVSGFVSHVTAHADSVRAAYGAVETFITRHQPALAAHFAADPHKPHVALAAARGMRVLAVQLTQPTPGTRFTARDAGMADHAEFLLDVLYPGKKVILLGHNRHVAHRALPEDYVSMGQHLHERRGAEVYTIGMYLYSGSLADNARQVGTVPLPHTAGSLESILYHARRRWSFVDFSTRASTPETSWMFQPTTGRATGVTPMPITPAAFYDGVLFIHTVSPPRYLRP